jgi:hypothetical protein
MTFLGAVAILSGLSLIVIDLLYVALIGRAKANGDWGNSNVRIVLVTRTLGLLFIGCLLIIAGATHHGSLLIWAVGVMIACSVVSWWASRRNGSRITVGPAERR